MNRQYVRFQIVSFLLLLTIISCSSNTKQTEKIKTLKVDLEVSNLSDFLPSISKIKIIPLETNSNALIGSIQKIEVFNNRAYVLDVFSAQAVFIYDLTGKHLNTISSAGKGPTEYVSPWDMAIDPFNEEIIILDPGSKKILKYDMDGNFKQAEYVDYFPYAIGFVDKETYCIKTMVGKKPAIILTKHNGKKTKEVHFGTREFNMNLFSHFPRSNGKQLYVEYMNDTIYEIGKDYIKPWMIIDFQDLAISPDKQEELKSIYNKNRSMPSVPHNLAGAVTPFFETESFYKFHCNFNGGMTSVLINKKTQEQKFVNKISRGSDLFTRLLLSVYAVGGSNTFIGKFNSNDLLDLLENCDYRLLKKQGKIEFEELGFPNQSEITLESNPILFTINYI
ncbi:MAG: 6-bladed beta-propeller [candidate division Zixibacteria bacterium]|nr:6-bladed beta-propeller [candidate division Zixibacteria bacterium]